MSETPYIQNPKTMKDMNFNIMFLVQKFNHEHSTQTKDIESTKEEVCSLKKDVNKILNIVENFKGMSMLLKIIVGIFGFISVLITIGAILSGFN